MRLITLDPFQPDPELVREAAAVLLAGGLVAFPTETVYGLGAAALDADAVARIFRAKGRPEFNPLIAHVADLAGARGLSSRWPELADRLGDAFWPGPLTLVVPKADRIPGILTAGLGTVAVRVPAHPVARALLEVAAIPVAAPSANRYTEVSPTTAEHVAKGLREAIDLILDAGPTPVGIESTVIDLSGAHPVLLRPGSISHEELRRVAGPIRAREEITGTAPRPGPGMVERHYSPRATLRLFPPQRRSDLVQEARLATGRGERVGAILLHPLELPIPHAHPMPGDPAGYARELYAVLHAMDDAGCDLILADEPPAAPGWEGIRDRLRRAANRG